MVWKPHVTVAALAEDEQGRFLLVEEHVAGALVINQPAGHLEPGESLLEAVRRETLEETGWRFSPEGLVGIYRWTNPDTQATFLRVTFCGHAGEHDPGRELDEGIVRALWLDERAVAARSDELRSPMVRRAIEDYRAGRRYPLDLLSDL